MPNQTKSEYLRDLSQCVFDLIEIIKTYLTEPIFFSKELNSLYHIRRETLVRLTQGTKPPGLDLTLLDISDFPSSEILFVPCRTEEQKAEVYKAEDNLSRYLGKIESERINNRPYRPNTGIKDGSLKECINGVMAKKQAPRRTEINEFRDRGKIITEDNGVFYYGNQIIKFGRGGFKNLYYQIFKIIYDKSQGGELAGGFVSYETIESELVSKHPERGALLDREKRNARILNALNNKTYGLLGKTKVGGEKFANDLTDGKKIIDIREGSGIIFTNQR
jgi:hypothetical protein